MSDAADVSARSTYGSFAEPPLRYEGAPARRQAILKAVKSAGFLSVLDLSQQLGVSDMTVRRDLRRLERHGEVRVVHGGVSLPSGSGHSPAFAGRAELHADGKARIGRAAAAVFTDNATIAVDAGTTTYAAVQAIPEDFAGTVVTHSVPVMHALLAQPRIRVVGLGGELLRESQAFVGPRTVEAAQGLRVQTLLLGAAAADEHGVYIATDNERPTKQALMALARHVVLLADTTKFTSPAHVLLCDWTHIHTVITDAPLPPHITDSLTRYNVPTHVAD